MTVQTRRLYRRADSPNAMSNRRRAGEPSSGTKIQRREQAFFRRDDGWEQQYSLSRLVARGRAPHCCVVLASAAMPAHMIPSAPILDRATPRRACALGRCGRRPCALAAAPYSRIAYRNFELVLRYTALDFAQFNKDQSYALSFHPKLYFSLLGFAYSSSSRRCVAPRRTPTATNGKRHLGGRLRHSRPDAVPPSGSRATVSPLAPGGPVRAATADFATRCTKTTVNTFYDLR